MTSEMVAVLYHPWTKETAELVIDAVTETVVTVWWPGCGLYEIDLRTGEVTARSKTAKRRAKGRQHWQARDLQELRDRVRIHIDGFDRRAETRRLMAEHEKKMPGKDGRDLSVAAVRRILGH